MGHREVGGSCESGLLARRRGATEPLLEGRDPPLEAGHALRVVSSAFQDGLGEPVFESFVQAVELLALGGHHADQPREHVDHLLEPGVGLVQAGVGIAAEDGDLAFHAPQPLESEVSRLPVPTCHAGIIRPRAATVNGGGEMSGFRRSSEGARWVSGPTRLSNSPAGWRASKMRPRS